MIFSHMQKPLGMRIYRIDKRISVHEVPLDTSWFCPYCCATVDIGFANLRATGSRTRKSASLPRLLVTPALRQLVFELHLLGFHPECGFRHTEAGLLRLTKPGGLLTSEYTSSRHWCENGLGGSSFSWLRGGPPRAMDHLGEQSCYCAAPMHPWDDSPRGAPPEDQGPSRCDASLPG